MRHRLRRGTLEPVIDLATGELLTIAGERIGPATALETFRASSPGAGALEIAHDGAWHAYRLMCAERPGRLFAVVLDFEGSRLADLKLALWSRRYGGARGDWSLDKERARKRAHDQVLASLFGSLPPYDLYWGRIESLVGADGGTSVIWMHYWAMLQA